jgi:hypothetical protein
MLLWDVQPLPPPGPLDALHVHRPASLPKERRDAAVAVAPVLPGERDDALSDNMSAVDVLDNDKLKIIAYELLKGLRANASIDWVHRNSARARLWALVKRIPRRYGYLPDLEDAVGRAVIAHAEAMLREMTI